MNGPIIRLVGILMLSGMVAGACAAESPQAPPAGASAAVDVRPLPLEWITPGTVIGESAPRGWTHLILIATPRIGAGDVDAVPRTAAHYSGLLHFTLLANVKRDEHGATPSYYLDRVGMGSALEINGRMVIATSDQTFGKDIGFIGRRVFEENDTILRNDFRRVARTRTMQVFDARATMAYNGRHTTMIIRHVVLVSPHDGKLTTMVWLLGSDGHNGYAVAERALQLLPPNMHEDRVLSVDGNKFTLGIPAKDAFALARIPIGTPVKYTPTLIPLASTRQFTPDTVVRLESELQTRYAPLVANAPTSNLSRR